jgi:hypothetical protein
MAKSNKTSLIISERIERRIYLIRGVKVLLSHDLAQLYEVDAKVLNQSVTRNLDRFPEDFMFRLTSEEFDSLRSQIVTSKGRGGRRYLPYAFTEQGVAMLSSVLRSKRAVQVNIEIMRAFVRLRQVLASHTDLNERLEDLEVRMEGKFSIVFEAIDKLAQPPTKSNRKIGFMIDKK